MLTPFFAQRFADSWYSAWNARDIDRIMAHYAPHIEHSSPFFIRYNVTDAKSLIGKDPVRVYFERALEANPTLHFNPMHLTVGIDSVCLIYRRMNGDLASEVFLFDHAGKIVRSISHYGTWTAGTPI